MMALLMLLAAHAAAAHPRPRTGTHPKAAAHPVARKAAKPATDDSPHGPVAPPVAVIPADIRMAPSISVRAATFDMLHAPLAAPRHIRLGCIVYMEYGTPVMCIPAEALGVPATWEQVDKRFDAFFAKPVGKTAGEESLHDLQLAAVARVLNTRLRQKKGLPGAKSLRLFIFDELFSPDDAPPAPADSDLPPLAYKDVTLTRPLDADLLQDLYPGVAMIDHAEARVAITCRIQPDRSLLCRKPGHVGPLVDRGPREITPFNEIFFTLASYQAAGMVMVEPKTVDGQDVVGRDLMLSFRWQMPEELRLPANLVPAPGYERSMGGKTAEPTKSGTAGGVPH